MHQHNPDNMDPHPKRRRDKDNPYTIFTVGIHTDHPHYYLSFVDSQGVRICTEIQKELFDLLDRFELEDLSHLNEVDNHYEQSELTEISLQKRMLHPQESLEDAALRREQHDRVHMAIAQLSPVQQRRLRLYYFCGLKYEEIAQLEGCTFQAVAKSISSAEKRLKNILSEG